MPVLEGTAYYAHVTMPNTRFEPCYSVNLVVDDATAAKFKSEGFSVKEMEDIGKSSIVIKRKVAMPNGSTRDAPRLVDRNKNPLDVTVGNGSKVKVQYRVWETDNKYGSFKGLDFQAMQVIDLVEGTGADGSEFTAEDTSMEDEL